MSRQFIDLSIPLENDVVSDPAPFTPKIHYMEKLHNLEVLPPYGFTLVCFPVKIRGASAGWTRAVAIRDEENP